MTLATCTGQARAQADSSTSFTFEKVRIRNEGSIFHPTSTGTLVVSPAVVSFRSAKATLEIPVDSIREVTVERTEGLLHSEEGFWLIVRHGASAAHRFQGKESVEIRDAITRVAGSEHCAEPSAKDALIILGRNFVEPLAKRGFPAPPARLLSDPNTTGMLILDGDLDGNDLAGAAVIREGDRSCIVRSGPAGLKGVDGVILFTGLSAGRYVVRILCGEHQSMVGDGTGHTYSSTFATIREAVDNSLETNEYLRGLGEPGPLHLHGEDLNVTIEVGTVEYFGRVHFKTWPGDLAVPVIEHDPAREQRVRELFLNRYPGTRWSWIARE